MPRKISIEKNELEQLFLERKLSTDEIADMFNLKRATVNYYLRKYDIRHRGLPERSLDREYMYKLYVEDGLKAEEIAKIVGISYSTVYQCLKKLGINNNDRYENLYSITPVQHDIIIGSLLGDGYLYQSDVGSRLSISHAENQKDYLIGKFKILKSLCGIDEVKMKDNSHTENHQNLYYFYTKCIPQLNKYHNLTIKDQLDSLNVNSFAVWLMDDGHHSVREKRNPDYSIAARRFTREEIYYSIKVIKDKFDINAKLDMYSVKNDEHMGIKFNVKETEKIKREIINLSDLASLVKDTMSYKYYDYKNN